MFVVVVPVDLVLLSMFNVLNVASNQILARTCERDFA